MSARRIFFIGIAVFLISAFFPLKALLSERVLNDEEAKLWSGGKGFDSVSGAQTVFHFGEWVALAEAGTDPGRDSLANNQILSDGDEADSATTVFYRPWPRRNAGSSVEDTPTEKVIAALEGSRLVDESQEAYTQFYTPWPGQVPKPRVKPVPTLQAKAVSRPRVIPLVTAPLPAQSAENFHLGESTGDSRLSDKPTKFLDVPNKGVPERPPLLFELGDPFLHQGNLKPGYRAPHRLGGPAQALDIRNAPIGGSVFR